MTEMLWPKKNSWKLRCRMARQACDIDCNGFFTYMRSARRCAVATRRGRERCRGRGGRLADGPPEHAGVAMFVLSLGYGLCPSQGWDSDQFGKGGQQAGVREAVGVGLEDEGAEDGELHGAEAAFGFFVAVSYTHLRAHETGR